MSKEIRWYKGKYKVKVILKGKKPKGVKHCPVTWLVEALANIPLVSPHSKEKWYWIFKGEKFTTVPRLLWRHPRK